MAKKRRDDPVKYPEQHVFALRLLRDAIHSGDLDTSRRWTNVIMNEVSPQSNPPPQKVKQMEMFK